MVIVKIKDKRYYKGYNLKSFNTNIVTEEIIQFVKDNPKAYQIEKYNGFCHTRETFLKIYTNQAKEVQI